MLVLNRPGPISRGLGGVTGFVKEYNVDRKTVKGAQENSFSDGEDDGHEWAQATDEAEQNSNEKHMENDKSRQSMDEFVTQFLKRYPAPPLQEKQPIEQLSLPVILPQRRPQSRTRGSVRGYSPVLEAAHVSQQAWFDFLDGFEKSVAENGFFWAANAAVWVADKAYIASAGFSPWAKLATLTIHLSIESGVGTSNKYLDYLNNSFFKPRALFCLIVKYKPNDLKDLGEFVDVHKNITQTVAKRDDPQRSKWKTILDSASSTTKQDAQMPEFAPLVFPFIEKADAKQKEGAWKHFTRFRREYQDRQAHAKFDVQNPDSKLADVLPQQEWTSRYINPNHPARQGGALAVLTGGKHNPKSPIQKFRERRKEKIEGGKIQEEPITDGRHDSEKDALAPPVEAELQNTPSNVSSDGTDRNEVAWQTQQKKRQSPMRRLLRQDVLYLMVINMPCEEDMEIVRRELEGET